MPYYIKALIIAGVIATVLIYVWWLTARADAQSPLCGKRADLIADLAARYGEEPIAMGLSSSGRLFEVFAAADGKTWTMMITPPNGRSCVVDAGEGWEELTLVPKGNGT